MRMKFIVAALASGLLVAACGDDSGSGGGGGGTASGGGSGASAQFVKNCQSQMETRMEKQAARLEKLGDGLKDKVLNAARGMCGCIAKEVEASDKISAEDKAKVWAVKDFSAKSKPDISDSSKAAFQEVAKKCAGQMMAVMMEVMKKAQEKMKENK